MLDPSNDFNSPCYDDIFRRVKVFEEFGDSQKYFVELDYYIMREAFVSRKGTALNLGQTHYDDADSAENIFRDITDTEREYLTGANMEVLEESIDIASSKFGDIYHVTELYGYAPETVFKQYESVVATAYGWEQIASDSWENLEKSKIVYDFTTGTYRIDNATIAAAVSIGDELSINGFYQGYTYGFEPTKVVDISATAVYVSCCGGSLITSNGITNVDSSYMMFWTKFPNGYFNNCNTPTSWSVFRRKKIKESAQVVSLAEHWITFHYDKPANLQGQYAPKNRNGAQVDSFSLTTTPTVWEHINKVNNGELVLIEDEKIDPQLFHGLYKKTATYVPAK